MNQSSSSSSEGGTSVGCVGAMRGLRGDWLKRLLSMMDLGCVDAMRGVRGDFVEEIAHRDGLAQKCISFSVHKRSTKEEKNPSQSETKRERLGRHLGG